ncbi:hypothetical protein [Microvirga arsenatis]|uniref:Uncharacterized protein n=1 Tax=Microvirga arsenatis TaxID=2692265 RepID=A0ABW9YSZ9_9HYPH|nr:hypothetical protein [Microvirga arsenatis]NBJ09673.1 hypothetical protein [Microvirga arsenatis]NBJ23468.1 hypothetical protein [Microvirga arsenatis]
MALFDFFARFSPSKRKAEKARQELMANAEKALRMKQEAGPQTNIPEHQTAHEGMQKDPHMVEFDRSSGREAGFTPQLKRSKVARSGDAS